MKWLQKVRHQRSLHQRQQRSRRPGPPRRRAPNLSTPMRTVQTILRLELVSLPSREI